MTSPVNVGDIVAGKYRVERVLGRGGMSVVVAARHVHLGEIVAIKFPLPRVLARSDVVARVMREGRAAARIKSEHVARVYDVDTLDTGEPYLVLEYLRGKDLDALLDSKGPLPIETALEYVLQACEALAEAHAHGIVHRDLKPSNLFLTRRADGSAVIKVIDFGIAKAESAEADANLTDSKATMGTPLYMAPEQMRSARDVDARADVWALGAILYRLITGSPPYLAGSLPEVYQLIMAGPPTMKLREARPDVSARLEEALLRCLQKDPADRFPNVAELAAALAEHAPAAARVSSERAKRILERPPETDDGARISAAMTAGPDAETIAAPDPAMDSTQNATPDSNRPLAPAPAPRVASVRAPAPRRNTPALIAFAIAAAAVVIAVWSATHREQAALPLPVAPQPSPVTITSQAAPKPVETLAAPPVVTPGEPEVTPLASAPPPLVSASIRAPIGKPRASATATATARSRGPLDDPD